MRAPSSLSLRGNPFHMNIWMVHEQTKNTCSVHRLRFVRCFFLLLILAPSLNIANLLTRMVYTTHARAHNKRHGVNTLNVTNFTGLSGLVPNNVTSWNVTVDGTSDDSSTLFVVNSRTLMGCRGFRYHQCPLRSVAIVLTFAHSNDSS